MKTLSRCALALLACGALASSVAFADGPDPDRHIVKFEDVRAGRAAVEQAGGTIVKDLPEVSAAAAHLPLQALQALERSPFVEYIEPDLPRYPMGEVTPYGITMVQADQVSDSLTANRTVCIIDSGYDLGHPDLPSGSNVSGYDGNLTWFEDGSGHGTHVAGTVVALGGNGEGVVGVNPGGTLGIFIVRVFGDDGTWAYSSDLIDAAFRCRDGGADVISMSLGCSGGGGGPFSCASSTEDAAFQDLNDNDGILSIAAAGNDGSTSYSYPASYDSVLSVAAVDEFEVVADFSQQNDQVELAGPGVGVLSTVPRGTGFNVGVTVGTTAYEAAAMQETTLGSATGALVDCGDAGAFNAGTACNGTGGHVCLIERGSISFEDKVLNCEASGGVAAVIYNNVAGMLFGTLSSPTATTIPAVGTSDTNGAAMLTQLGESTTVTVEAGDYDYFSGTSMATPHVSGVAALVWSHNSTWTNAEIRNALTSTAKDLGAAGYDNAYGHGLVQAKAALDFLTGGTTNSPPNASFTSSCADLTCDFTDTSTDSDGSIASWSWDFGDGATSTAQHPTHTYGADGTYTVTLTVTDDGGATDTASGDVTVSGSTTNSPPSASFSSSCADLTCDFTDTSTDSDGSIASWSWDFGDGATSTAQHPSHTYGADGTYTVTLTVTDDGGATDTASGDVTVSGSTTEPTTMHVASLTADTLSLGQGFKRGVVTVVIHDDQGNPVGSATVTGTFSGDVSGTVSGTTGGDGSVSLSSSDKKGRLKYQFCVDSVTHGSLTYDSSANAVTCVSN